MRQGMGKIIAAILVIGLVVVAGWQMLGARLGSGTGPSELRASGTIEADEYRVSAQTGGR
jgi:hypothetical protein